MTIGEVRLSRRAVLAGSAALAAATTAGSLRAVAEQANPVHKTTVGSAKVTVVSDGELTLPLSFVLPGRPQAEIDAAFAAAKLGPPAGLKAEVNVAIVEIGGSIVLVDTGGGPDFMAGLGKLADRLDQAGIKPEAVTHVVFTHAHADHLWGVMDPLGDGSLFPNAKHVMSAAERDYWLDATVESKVPDAFKSMAAGTHRRLKALGDRVTTAQPGSEIVPGLALVDTRGHTPGHVSVAVKSGGAELLIGGDALSQSIVSFAQPDWRWGPDMEPDTAIATRKRLLDMLASSRAQLLGYHLPWPGLGRVEKNGNAYRYVAG